MLATDLMNSALDRYATLDMPFERARTLLAAGSVHRRQRHKRLALGAIAEAVEVFDRLGAGVWTARALNELDRIGGRRNQGQLSETERRVTKLAASGLSNREIAMREFLAPKTVENALGRAYGKLGVRTRAELAARASRLPLSDILSTDPIAVRNPD